MSARRAERIKGGLASGMSPRDFDPIELRRGALVELEHSSDWAVAREIAMDHLVEDPDYYVKLARIESHQPNRRSRTRARVYEAESMARQMRETFADRPVERHESMDFGWPAVMQNIGDSLAVAYASDKWKPRGKDGKREVELYKHLAESRNRVLAVPGALYDYFDQSRRWPTIGPKVSLADCPMPRHFAVLGLFAEIDLKLYVAGSDAAPRFEGSQDGGVVHVSVRNGYLGGAKILWSELGRGKDEPFIFVYTKAAGVMFLVVGDRLAIAKDGIVG